MKENAESLLLEERARTAQEEARGDDLLLQLHAAHQREVDLHRHIWALEAKVLLLQGLRG
jgi:hypothetical protein